MRKAAASVALMISLAIPAFTIAGLCANLPCCVRTVPATDRIGLADCCNPVACAETPAQDLVQPSTQGFVAALSAIPLVFNAPLPVAPSVVVAIASSPPPPTAPERLSRLSILLI